MRTKTVTVSEGELLGPVDWSYDFTSHDWSQYKGVVNPEVSARAKGLLRQIEVGLADGKRVEAAFYSDYHQPVIEIGMYDGWPYWRPVPSIFVRGTLGGEWHSFCSLMGVRISDQPAGDE